MKLLHLFRQVGNTTQAEDEPKEFLILMEGDSSEVIEEEARNGMSLDGLFRLTPMAGLCSLPKPSWPYMAETSYNPPDPEWQMDKVEESGVLRMTDRNSGVTVEVVLNPNVPVVEQKNNLLVIFGRALDEYAKDKK